MSIILTRFAYKKESLKLGGQSVHEATTEVLYERRKEYYEDEWKRKDDSQDWTNEDKAKQPICSSESSR